MGNHASFFAEPVLFPKSLAVRSSAAAAKGEEKRKATQGSTELDAGKFLVFDRDIWYDN